MIQDKIFFDEKDPTGLSYNTPFTFYGSYQGRLYSKTPTGSVQYYTQNSDLSAYATTGSNQFSGSQTITGSLTVTGTITGTVAGTTATASYVEYTNVANKPALISGSSQVTYSGLTGVPSGIVSGSAQVASFGIFATTGSNGFNGSQSITGSLTVTGQVVAQTLNVQQVTSSIVYSSGSNVFGNSLSNTQQFTGSVGVTGSLTSNGALTGTSATFTGTTLLGGATATNPLSIRTANGESYIRFLNADGSSYGDLERSITGAGAVRFTGANFRFTAGAEVVGALTGSIATFSSTVSATQYTATSTGGSGLRVYGAAGTNQWDIYLNSTNLRFSDNTGTGSIVFDRPLSGTSAVFSSSVQGDFLVVGTTAATSGGLRLGTQVAIRARNVANTANIPLIESTASDGVSVSNGALTLASTGAATFSVASGIYTAVNITSPNTSVYYKLTPTGGDSYLLGAGVNATNDFSIYNSTRSAAYLTITGGASGGNVGIGTTSPANKLFVVASGTPTTNGNNSGVFISHLTTGATTDGVGIGSTGASTYKWIQSYNGNLCLNPEGNNVGIGTASPSSKLTVLKTITTNVGATGNAALSLGTAGSSGEYNLINFGYDAGTWQPAYLGYVATSGAGSSNGALVFGTRDVTTDSQPTERMRITASGQVQITNSILRINASSTTSVSTSATTISTGSNTYGGIAIVWGADTGGNIWTDLLFYSLGQVYVIRSQDVSGGPYGRTYTVDGSGSLRLAMGGGTYTVRYQAILTS